MAKKQRLSELPSSTAIVGAGPGVIGTGTDNSDSRPAAGSPFNVSLPIGANANGDADSLQGKRFHQDAANPLGGFGLSSTADQVTRANANTFGQSTSVQDNKAVHASHVDSFMAKVGQSIFTPLSNELFDTDQLTGSLDNAVTKSGKRSPRGKSL